LLISFSLFFSIFSFFFTHVVAAVHSDAFLQFRIYEQIKYSFSSTALRAKSSGTLCTTRAWCFWSRSA
jgi:hypothetical protein